MYAYANNYLFYFKKSNKKYDSFFCIITKFYLPKNLPKKLEKKLLPILAATIAAGLLVLATSNAAVAQTSSQSIIGGLNAQGTKCQSGTTGDGTCNQAAANENVGNAVSAGSNALSAIGQANQRVPSHSLVERLLIQATRNPEMPTQVTQFPLDYHRNSIDKPSKQPSSFFIFLVFISSQRRQDTNMI
jgi:hypothetical protein